MGVIDGPDARWGSGVAHAPELVASWGALDEPEELLFTRANIFAVDPLGRLIVHDINRGVRWFEPDGRFLGYLARYGEGPREVQYSQALAGSGRGEIAIRDQSNPKVLRFDSTGVLRSAVRHEVPYSSLDESGLVYLPPCADTFDGTCRQGYRDDKRAPWCPVMTTAMGPDGSVAWSCSDGYSGFPTTPRVFIRGDSIWAVRKGSLDEDYISKYVVRWP